MILRHIKIHKNIMEINIFINNLINLELKISPKACSDGRKAYVDSSKDPNLH